VQDNHSHPRHRSGIVSIILGRLAIVVLLGLAVSGGLVWGGMIVIPNHLNPFSPLRIADGSNWLTRYKLSRLERNDAQCLAVLGDSDVSHKPVSDRPLDQGCGLSNAVEVTRSAVELNRSFTATCSLTVAWALFETDVLLPAARQHLGQDVARVTHVGTYACRNVNHRVRGRRSEHATANAIDIAGFVLADGQRISVKDDWEGSHPGRSAFLRALRDGACGIFDVVLSPDYNEAHHDHFHFDMGSYRTCR
jgi:hypothetical protein